ncbi:MAG: UDP-N-acetylglucosamine 2-epimerase (non-hydrolyzing) [Gammaproteobacteria bacterium]
MNDRAPEAFEDLQPAASAAARPGGIVPCFLLHTGQHYDREMKESFFRQLGIPEPDVDLDVGSASHAVQTAEIMRRFEPVVDTLKPEALLVVGDVNSTIACALVAAKKGIPIIHVEAGLRSFDRSMPEEINRVLTDQISDLLFTTEADARINLEREGIPGERIHFVGNVMIDTLLRHRRHAVPAVETLTAYAGRPTVDLVGEDYALLTMHRPSNVDDPTILGRLVDSVSELSEELPIIFPVHPRTRSALQRFGMLERMSYAKQVVQLPAVSYLEMLGLMVGSTYVLTDSGGVQEETTALGIPCITLRENTERPITVEQGTNTIVGSDPDLIRSAVREVLLTGGKAGLVPEKWDGNAAARIRDVIVAWMHARKPATAGQLA